MGVDLGSAETLMPEKLLDDAQVCATVEQVRRKRVAECMWMKCLGEPCSASDVIESCPGAALTKWTAVAI